MSTDYHILLQKFYNFKEFVGKVCNKPEVIKDYENMSDSEFLLFGLGFLLPNKSKMELIVAQMVTKIGVTEEEHITKIRRYLECFTEYLEQINSQEAVLNTIAQVANEKIVAKP